MFNVDACVLLTWGGEGTWGSYTHYNVHLFFIIDTERAGEGSWQREIEPDVYKSYLLYEDALLWSGLTLFLVEGKATAGDWLIGHCNNIVTLPLSREKHRSSRNRVLCVMKLPFLTSPLMIIYVTRFVYGIYVKRLLPAPDACKYWCVGSMHKMVAHEGHPHPAYLLCCLFTCSWYHNVSAVLKLNII